MANIEMPHEEHEKHLCYLNNLGYQLSHPTEYNNMVRDGKFVCQICGRVAGKKENLCKPAEL